MRDNFYDEDGYIDCLNDQIDRLQEDYYDLQLQHEDKIKELELRILKNFINMMPYTYRQRNVNWIVVRDILMSGTSHMGRTSCIDRCVELGIEPDGYIIY